VQLVHKDLKVRKVIQEQQVHRDRKAIPVRQVPKEQLDPKVHKELQVQ
jgi:hypothetical protein